MWDGFCYNGEMEALHTRLSIPGIDKRVIVEALTTHSGKLKDGLFYQWSLPGVVLVTPDLSELTSCWARENAQRNAIMQGLVGARTEDAVLLSDADEIPSADGVKRALQALKEHKAVVLEQRMYNFSRAWTDARGWRGTVATTYGHLLTTSPQALRDQRETLPRIPDAGEHLSWFGGTEEIKRKLQSYAHQEYAGMADDSRQIQDKVEKGLDLFGRWALSPATS